jgi:hypothetical protein
MEFAKLIEDATNNYIIFYKKILTDLAMDLYFLYAEQAEISPLKLPCENLHKTPLYLAESPTPLPYCIVGLQAKLQNRNIFIYEQVLYNFFDKAVYKISSVVVCQAPDKSFVTVIAPEKTEEEREELMKKFISIIKDAGYVPQ